MTPRALNLGPRALNLGLKPTKLGPRDSYPGTRSPPPKIFLRFLEKKDLFKSMFTGKSSLFQSSQAVDWTPLLIKIFKGMTLRVYFGAPSGAPLDPNFGKLFYVVKLFVVDQKS